ncbi:MAG: hypothetical protein PHE56_09325 [Bacteroidales bacterium]|nr:hypothetical protein [Bacteroidales bacterium]
MKKSLAISFILIGLSFSVFSQSQNYIVLTSIDNITDDFFTRFML